MDIMGLNVWEVIMYAGLLWTCWNVGKFVGRVWAEASNEVDEAEAQQIADNRILIRVEEVEQPPHDKVLLVFNSMTDKFIGQSMTPEGVLELIYKTFDTSKQLYLQSGTVVVPLTRPLSKTAKTVEPKDES